MKNTRKDTSPGMDMGSQGKAISKEVLLDLMDDPLVVVDRNRMIVFANRPYLEGLRRTHDEVVGKGLFQFLTGPESIVFQEALDQILGGKVKRTHFVIQSAKGDGTRAFFHVAASALSQDEQILGAVVISRDVTDREAAREELQRERHRYRRLIEKMQEILLVFDKEGKIYFSNPAFHRILGYATPSPQGWNVMELVHPDDLSKVKELTDDLFSGRRPSYRKSILLKDTHGLYRLTETSAIPMVEEGRVVAVQWIGRDVTERERRRRHLVEALKELEKRQAVLFADMSLAGLVHRSLLPRPIVHPRVLVDTEYRPLIGVGGDYVNLHLVRKRWVKAAIFDVTGHGLAASLMANRVHAEIDQHLQAEASPLKVIERTNDFVLEHFTKTGLFLSMFVVFLDVNTGNVRYAGAGHVPGILRREGGKVRLLESENFLVGVMGTSEMKVKESRVRLGGGDAIVLYTDGFTDRLASESDPVGVKRLSVVVKEVDLGRLEEHLCRILSDRVEDLSTERPVDDMTLVVIKYRGKGTSKGFLRPRGAEGAEGISDEGK